MEGRAGARNPRPRGRIDFTPDEVYKQGQEKMGLDLAKLLDANCSKK